MRRAWLVIAVVAASPENLRAQAQSPDTTARIIDRVFDAYRGNDRPGCALGVSRNGRVVLERGYGMANLETGTPIQPASIFHVASVSKQFTAAAIMLLVRDGALSLDDNIRKYVSEVPDYGTPITVRHLLNHTSGLRDQWELLALARGRFEENRITENDVLDIVNRQKALNFTPGTEYLYSNTGYTLLGTIVKRVSGKSLRDYADEKIFKPLSMTHTHFHDDYTMLVPGRTSAYAPIASGWRVSVPNFDVYGATSLFTTVGDLLKWEANFDNPIVGDRALFDQMQTTARLTNGDTLAYGLGVVMDRYRGLRRVSHNGADAGYRSYAGRLPEQGLAITIACNAATANTTALANGVADAYLAGALAPLAVASTPAAIPVAAEALQRRVGVYVQPSTGQVVEIGMRNGQLIAGRTTGPVLTPVAENRFRPVGGAVEIHFKDGEHAAFEQRPLAGGRPVLFEWRQPVPPGTSLAAFAGDYFSEELNALYRVTADTMLAFRTGTSNPFSARPIFTDAFLGGGYTVQFIRKGRDVTGFEITNSRMRRVKFTRLVGPR